MDKTQAPGDGNSAPKSDFLMDTGDASTSNTSVQLVAQAVIRITEEIQSSKPNVTPGQ